MKKVYITCIGQSFGTVNDSVEEILARTDEYIEILEVEIDMSKVKKYTKTTKWEIS